MSVISVYWQPAWKCCITWHSAKTEPMAMKKGHI